ncbi:hypothetical protein [Chryseobacterium sp.]|uniref:hypothetical protein n=1 Tax=Chryseobacterium sp. TaxID=1871047 RepID=UPI002FCA12CC
MNEIRNFKVLKELIFSYKKITLLMVRDINAFIEKMNRWLFIQKVAKEAKKYLIKE